MISASAEILGGNRLHLWLESAPARFRLGLYVAARDSVGIILDAARARTPRRRGELVSGEAAEVRVTPDGAVGRITSRADYTRFVEKGTRQHGEAHHMFLEAKQMSDPAVQGRFRAEVALVTADFSNL